MIISIGQRQEGGGEMGQPDIQCTVIYLHVLTLPCFGLAFLLLLADFASSGVFCSAKWVRVHARN